jgi:hypothetical protein
VELMFIYFLIIVVISVSIIPGILRCWPQWPRGLKHGSAALHLMGLRAQMPPGAWKSLCCECCVLLATGTCVGLIVCPEESC